MNYTLQQNLYMYVKTTINESDAQSVRQFENEMSISVYDDILKKCLNAAVRYSEVQDNLQYFQILCHSY